MSSKRDFSVTPLDALKQSVKFCMALDRRLGDRWPKFEQSTLQVLRDVKRYSAVDGTTLDVANDTRVSLETRVRLLYWKYRHTHQEMSHVGALGCSLSHIKAWDAFLETDAEYLLVLEDDALFTPDDMRKIERIKHFPAGWHMWVMGGDLLHFSRLDDTWVQVGEFHHTHALLLTRDGVKVLRDSAYPIEVQIDGYMGFLSTLGRLKIIHTFDVAIGTLSSRADISHQILWVFSDVITLLAALTAVSAIVALLYFRHRVVLLCARLGETAVPPVLNAAHRAV